MTTRNRHREIKQEGKVSLLRALSQHRQIMNGV
jgi:hypothetical protein